MTRPTDPPSDDTGSSSPGDDIVDTVGGPRPVMRYQPALDGLRGIGVFSVLFGHLSAVQPALARLGCFMFVDMFFVMSGFLITAPLIRERDEFGRVSMKGFYVRRISRVYPLIALVFVVALVQHLVAPDAPAVMSWLGLAGIAGYFANFVMIWNHADALSAWAPLWSLSIEEQYYLLWPLTLLVAGRRGRMRRPLVLLVVLTAAMWFWRSWSWYVGTAGGGDASTRFQESADAWHVFYFSTFHRPDGLLIGSALGIVLSRPDTSLARWLARATRILRWPAVLTLAALVYATASGYASWQIHFGLALFNLAVASLIVDLLYRPSTRLSSVLSFPPLTWVGRRCYFIYVAHLGVFMFVIEVLGWRSLPLLAISIACIFGLAALSYRYYETPVRRWGYRVSNRSLTRGRERVPDAGALDRSGRRSLE